MAGFTQKEDTELQTERKVQKALGALLLAPRREGWKVVEIKSAYATLVKQLHPDSGEPEIHPHMSLDDLRRHKDFLVNYLENKND